MVDWQRITGFEWDAANARKSEDKRGVSQAEAEQVFFNQPLLLLDDLMHSDDEPRIHALGMTDAGRRLHVTFTARLGLPIARDLGARHAPERTRGL